MTSTKPLIVSVCASLLWSLSAYGQVVPLSNTSEREGNTYRFFSYPKYYEDENGVLQQTNTQIERITAKTITQTRPGGAWDYEMVQGVYKVYLREDGTLRIQHQDWQMEYRLEDLAYYDPHTKRSKSLGWKLNPSDLRVEGNIATWVGIFPDVDLRITLQPGMMKEEILLHQDARNVLPQPATVAEAFSQAGDLHLVAKFSVSDVEMGSFEAKDTRGVQFALRDDVMTARLNRTHKYEEARTEAIQAGRETPQKEEVAPSTLAAYSEVEVQPAMCKDMTRPVIFKSDQHRGHRFPYAFAYLPGYENPIDTPNKKIQLFRAWEDENDIPVIVAGVPLQSIQTADQGTILIDPDATFDYTVVDDVTLYSACPYDHSQSMRLESYITDTGYYCYSLIRFNNLFSQLEANSQVDSASLRLYVKSDGFVLTDRTNTTVKVGAMKTVNDGNGNEDWEDAGQYLDMLEYIDDSSVQFLPYPCFAFRMLDKEDPLDHRPWVNDNVKDAGNVYYDDVASTNVSADTTAVWDVKDIVQNWLNQSYPNNGFFVYVDESYSGRLKFYCGYSEEQNANSPQLEVNIASTPTPIPTPDIVVSDNGSTMPAPLTSDTDTYYAPGDGELVVSWDNISGSFTHTLQRSTDGGSNYSTITDFDTSATSYEDDNLTGTSYRYRVKRSDGVQTSDWAESSAITFSLTVPDPSGVSIQAEPGVPAVDHQDTDVSFNGTGELVPNWNQVSGLSYDVQVDMPGDPVSWSTIVSDRTNSPYEHTGLTEDGQYNYRVKAKRNLSSFESGWTQATPVTLTVLTPTNTPNNSPTPTPTPSITPTPTETRTPTETPTPTDTPTLQPTDTPTPKYSTFVMILDTSTSTDIEELGIIDLHKAILDQIKVNEKFIVTSSDGEDVFSSGELGTSEILNQRITTAKSFIDSLEFSGESETTGLDVAAIENIVSPTDSMDSVSILYTADHDKVWKTSHQNAVDDSEDIFHLHGGSVSTICYDDAGYYYGSRIADAGGGWVINLCQSQVIETVIKENVEEIAEPIKLGLANGEVSESIEDWLFKDSGVSSERIKDAWWEDIEFLQHECFDEKKQYCLEIYFEFESTISSIDVDIRIFRNKDVPGWYKYYGLDGRDCYADDDIGSEDYMVAADFEIPGVKDPDTVYTVMHLEENICLKNIPEDFCESGIALVVYGKGKWRNAKENRDSQDEESMQTYDVYFHEVIMNIGEFCDLEECTEGTPTPTPVPDTPIPTPTNTPTATPTGPIPTPTAMFEFRCGKILGG